MPTVDIKRSLLTKRLGKEYSKEEFANLCFDFGIELDEVTSEFLQKLHEEASKVRDHKNTKIDFDKINKILHEHGELDEKTKKKLYKAIPDLETADTDELYKIDVPANRYDLLCVEGLTRALRIFEGREKQPIYQTVDDDEKSLITMKVNTANCNKIRPYVVAAILRNVTFDEDSYDSFIKLQEKLHFNICRKRTLVAIGTHDLDTLKPPFLFDACPPDDIKFKALKETKEMTAKELLEWYEDDEKNPLCPVKEYVYIIKDSPVYPIIYDSNDVVLSMPPIINGEHSKITVDTKNVFIESTATDLTKASAVLNTLVTMFSEYCSKPFSIEPVKIVYEKTDKSEEKSYITPNFELSLKDLHQTNTKRDIHSFETSVKYINDNLGTNLNGEKIVELLYKMGLNVSLDKNDADKLSVTSPPTRSDIMHPIDIVEDVAIAFGYNNIERRLPSSATTGKEFILNTVSDKIRNLVAMCGYTEVLNWCLISKEENCDNMLIEQKEKENQMVQLVHPKATQFEICRTNLLPGIFKTLSANIGQKNVSLPLYLFEVGDVVLCDKKYAVGSRNERRLAAIICSKKHSGLQYIHGLMDRIMQQNEITFLPQIELEKKYRGKWPNKIAGKRFYSIRKSSKPTFLPARQAEIIVDNKPVGYFGIIHPKVLKNFNIMQVTPVLISALEINIECFVKRTSKVSKKK